MRTSNHSSEDFLATVCVSLSFDKLLEKWQKEISDPMRGPPPPLTRKKKNKKAGRRRRFFSSLAIFPAGPSKKLRSTTAN